MSEAEKLQEKIKQLEKELAKLKKASKPAKSKAKVKGGGAVAQGTKAKAVGQNGILIEGGVYIGAQPKNDAQALTIYRRVLMQTTSSLPLRGVDVGVSDPTATQKPLGLANVYIDLDTTSKVGKHRKTKKGEEPNNWMGGVTDDVETMPVLMATIAWRQIVLLGDPGSGKSTFVNFLAYCLAANAVEPKEDWLKHLPKWPKKEGTLLPVPVILRDFSRWLSAQKATDPAPRLLLDFIAERLHAQNLDFAAPLIESALDAGKCILLFDGLDEVTTQTQRAFVRDTVRSFLNRYPANRAILTCRVLSYQPPVGNQPDLRLNELSAFEIAPFDEKKITRFVQGWYAELGRLGTVAASDVEPLTGRLQEAVRRPDLQRLAPNPLLLTVMALVHTHQGRLPDARALLYEETVDILLWRWEQVKVGGRDDASRLRQLLLDAGRTEVDLKRVLWELAYEAHASSKSDDGEALADIGELRLEKALASLKGDDRTWAQEIIETIKLRAGLLIERVPEVFTFPHRTFQEYLAGAHLAAQKDFSRCAANLAKEGALWREVILLATGKLVYLSGDLDKPLALVGELCPEKTDNTPLGWQKAWLAGDVLQEIGTNRVLDSNLGKDLHGRVQTRLKNLIETSQLAPRERARAGVTLSILGDPRFNPDRWHLPKDDTLGFISIPAGKFLMGSGENDKQARDNEKPQHELDLPEFWMAKYPVTVAQFRAFVEATNYSFKYWQHNPVATRPIVSVTWYDALEYTKWLDGKLRHHAEKQIAVGNKHPLWQGLAEGKLHLTLPSEAEWEKAARGSPRLLGEGLGGEVGIYPWGDEFDPAKANTRETQLGDPSVVGCFPAGASPYGLLDMSGNVWEWTRSLYGNEYPYIPNDGREDLQSKEARILRGGSFYDASWGARCSFRLRLFPVDWRRYYGFRVVVSQSFSL